MKRTEMVKNSKDIVCYNCNKKGTAEQVKKLRTTDRKTETKKLVWTWQAKGFKMISPDFWLCLKCNERKCLWCGILLSNTRICKGIEYGTFYPKHPKYCKDCWDEIKEAEAKENEHFAEQAEKAKDNALEEAQRTDN